MKKLLISLTFLICFYSLFAENQDFSNDTKQVDEKYYQINTKYFQIIYQQKSIETATILYENVDKIYEDLAEKLNTDTNLSMPILIRSDIQALNAYFTSFPYNKIVMYDTVIDNKTLAVFSETVLSIFYHELVHAVTLNMKSKPWQIASSLFGDFFSPYVFTSPTMFSEGATVSFESATGEGRLNSGNALNVLIQAKLEDNLPDWKEASGANDKYRIGDYPYIFGGAFHQFLQEKYGMEKYSELWKELGSSHIFTEVAFKKVYGTKLKHEWQDFLDSIPLLQTSESNSVFLTNKLNIPCYTSENDTIIYFSTSDNGIFSIENGKTQKILSEQSVKDLALSKDKRFLAITKLTDKYQYITYVYDLSKKRYLKGCLESFRLPEFLQIDDKLVLLGFVSHQNKQSIQYYQIEENSNLKCDEDINQNWKYFTNPEILDISKGKNKNEIAVLGKDNSKWILAEISVDKLLNSQNETSKLLFDNILYFPENIQPLSLSCFLTKSYSISYTENDYSLSKFASIVDNKIYFQTEDILGGVNSPMVTENGFIFINRNLKYDRLAFVRNIPGGLSSGVMLNDFSDSDTSQSIVEKIVDNMIDDEKSNQVLSISNKYKDISYIGKTAFIPLLSNFDLSQDSYYSYKTSASLPGFTLFWQNPLENKLVGMGFGILPKIMSSHISFYNKAFFDTYFVVSGVFENENRQGFEFSESNLSLSVNKTLQLPRENLRLNFDFDALLYIPNNLKLIQLSNTRIELAGIYSGLGLGFFQQKQDNTDFYTPSFYTFFEIPRLLPFSNPLGFTLNLPLYFSGYLCKDVNSFFDFQSNLILFSAEIHKSIPLIPLYVNRFSVTSGYFLSLKNKKAQNFDFQDFYNKFTNIQDETNKIHGITASAFFELTPIIGNLVNLHPKFGVDFRYYFDYESNVNKKPYEITIAGMFTF